MDKIPKDKIPSEQNSEWEEIPNGQNPEFNQLQR